jgi:hypothetical protein
MIPRFCRTIHKASRFTALNYDNLQLATHFVELFTKHPDLPPQVKWLLASKLIQKVLPFVALCLEM